jgi:hypothetical protein
MMITKEMVANECDLSIIELSKRKNKLIDELNNIDQQIAFLRQQKENVLK